MMEGVPVFQALAGGVLIGLGATLLMLGDGRIAGIAGILGGAYGGAPGERAWRIVFLLGRMYQFHGTRSVVENSHESSVRPLV